MRTERSPFEIYESSTDAVNALAMDAPSDALDTVLQVPSPLELREDRGVTYIAYDHDPWALNQHLVNSFLRSLVTDSARRRVVLDFSVQDRISHPTLQGIMWLGGALWKVGGRFALCNINEHLLEILRPRLQRMQAFTTHAIELPRSDL